MIVDNSLRTTTHLIRQRAENRLKVPATSFGVDNVLRARAKRFTTHQPFGPFGSCLSCVDARMVDARRCLVDQATQFAVVVAHKLERRADRRQKAGRKRRSLRAATIFNKVKNKKSKKHTSNLRKVVQQIAAHGRFDERSIPGASARLKVSNLLFRAFAFFVVEFADRSQGKKDHRPSTALRERETYKLLRLC